MKDLTFRTLSAGEIEVRPATIQNGKATMLLYMDSRVVVNLLNETVGPLNWQSDFKEVNGQLIGSISIWDEDKNMWITKSDTGSESNVEAQKGLVSDCYKRCLSRWGVDELYSAPVIKIDDDGYKCTGHKVTEVAYDESRDIIHLVICNRFGKEAFRWDKGEKPVTQKSTVEAIKNDDGTFPQSNAEILKNFCASLKTQEGVNLEQLRKYYEFYSKKIDTWKNEFTPEPLWKRWMSTARS